MSEPLMRQITRFLNYTKTQANSSLIMIRIGVFPILFLLASNAQASNDVWLLIDTDALTLEVKKGGQTLERLENIAIGRNGAGFKEVRGDDVTPLGTYKIGWINEKSSFYRFFGLSYPSVDNAHAALDKGLIDPLTFETIVEAHQKHSIPPQNTPLGGQIGIHGLGRGDDKIHRTMNWTHGCIALTNRQIDRLSKWVDKEITVQIK
jgi:murein L,D-transpeptidase YafK